MSMQSERKKAWGQRKGPVAAFVRIRPDESTPQEHFSSVAMDARRPGFERHVFYIAEWWLMM